jgi:hypothetical protein
MRRHLGIEVENAIGIAARTGVKPTWSATTVVEAVSQRPEADVSLVQL